jgi:hypothetical protein
MLVVAALALALAAGAPTLSASATVADGLAPPLEADAPVASLSPPLLMMLFDFEGSDGPRWSIENDGVMGGRSQGFVEIADGTLVFTGEVVTRGGGFTSVRAARRVDLSGYDGIELRVRGGGRTFALDIDDGTRSRGRQVTRRGPVPTTDTWETVRVPFASLQASAHGQRVRVAPLDRSAVQSIGVYIIDGQDGPFRLEIDWIRAYPTAE